MLLAGILDTAQQGVMDIADGGRRLWHFSVHRPVRCRVRDRALAIPYLSGILDADRLHVARLLCL